MCVCVCVCEYELVFHFLVKFWFYCLLCFRTDLDSFYMLSFMVSTFNEIHYIEKIDIVDPMNKPT